MNISRNEIIRLMSERILMLDGATGTYLQQLNLTEDDFRGTLFRDHPTPLKGCNDVLCLTRPDAIEAMHRAYIDAGADIIETNSFNSNCFSLADYGLEDRVYDIARAAAECGRRAADKAMNECGKEMNESGRETNASEARRKVIVAGSMGPTNKTLSMSPDVNDPSRRDITYSQLAETYYDQVCGLIDGGADIVLVETIFDTLNAKAALSAVDRVATERNIDIPVMASGTLSDASGRTLSGQTVEAYYASLKHGRLLSIGLNCGFGARQLLPWLKRLAAVADCAISVHPNAGLPNVMGGYDETPETFADNISHFLSPDIDAPLARFVRPDSGCAYVNIVGGCCGTTPDHIRAAAAVVRNHRPRPLYPTLSLTTTSADVAPKQDNAAPTPSTTAAEPVTQFSGLEILEAKGEFVNIGERTNVAGSAKFKRLIQAGNYEEALSVARAQVSAGAEIIDVCMDDGMIDGVKAMQTFLNLIASEPDIARVPVMIDSSKWEIQKAGMECVQGKSIVNSISLKEGEARFIEKARHIHSMGAAVVVMLFDENGQADTYERKVEVARRAYKLLKTIDFPTEDVIFDPNVLAVATGMPEHNDYGRAFIEACRTIKEEMPEVHLSGGISNLSFSFRGNNTVRRAMHSVILHHATAVGLDMSIVNPAMTVAYDAIEPHLREVVEDVILNREREAADRLLALAQEIKQAEMQQEAATKAENTASPTSATTAKTLTESILDSFLTGNTDTIESDTMAAYGKTHEPLAVIDDYLMPAMEEVGRRFGDGKMFLPQVVKSARVMKKAVAVLEPFMGGKESTTDGARIVFATVKGDVHDIGKNIVSVVTQCNGYTVKDLGVMVDAETIVETAREWGADVIGLSGLITPSLDEMIRVVKLLESRGMTIPVIVGGATTSALHTAVKMAPEYPGGVVIRAHAAADNPMIIRQLTGPNREEYIAEQKSNQRLLRENYLSGNTTPLLSLDEARRRRHVKQALGYETAPLPHPIDALRSGKNVGSVTERIAITELLPLINWNFFFQAWGLKGDARQGKEGTELKNDALQMLHEMETQGTVTVMARAEILPAYSTDEDEIVVGGHTMPFPRSLRDEEETLSLADYVMRQGDYVCPYCVTAGIGLRKLQEAYRKDDDEYHAIMAKLVCDRLAQAANEWLEHHLTADLHWAKKNISMAFGYGACPDHALKRHVFDILDVENRMGLSLTDSFMITPEESICGLIFAETPEKYFNV